MFRLALRAAPRALPRVAAPVARVPAFRAYSAAAGLSRADVTSRVLEVLSSFEKVDEGKVSGLVLGQGTRVRGGRRGT
jgi:NADH dehydrogenase (ubiquinone) 1 alpha/beta subcomplex 1